MKSTPIEQCAGKTLQGHVFHISDQYLLLVWSDGCVTELVSEGDESDWIISQGSKYCDICFDGYDFDELIRAGIDPAIVKGLKQAQQAKLAEQVIRAREERRAEYERLKKEFEGGST